MDFAETNSELNKLNAQKDRLFSTISRDLQSPIADLLTTATLLRGSAESGDTAILKKHGDALLASASRAQKSVDVLVRWSRVHIEKPELDLSEFDIAALIHATASRFKADLDHKGIGLRVHDVASLNILSDRDVIGAILENILSNAVKFTHSGGAIDLRLQETPEEIVVTIKDDGVGIPDTALATLFSADQNPSTVGTDGETGAGLGLMLCGELANQAGVVISVESEVEAGTTMRLAIPIT